MTAVARRSKPLQIIRGAALFLLAGSLSPLWAAEIWVVPRQVSAPHELDRWVVAKGDSTFIFAVPDDFVGFQSAQVLVIGKKDVTINYDLGISISQDGGPQNQYSDALSVPSPLNLWADQMTEIDVSAMIPALVPGIDVVALTFHSSRPKDTYIVGLRFHYESDSGGGIDPADYWKKTENFNGDVSGLGTNLQLKAGVVGSPELAANSVDSSKVVDASLTGADLAPASVDSSKIVDGTVTTNDLANMSVTSDKIADGTVDALDLAPNSVNSSKIANGSIQTDELASGAVTTAKLADAAVDIHKLSANSVGTLKIIDGSIQAVDVDASQIQRRVGGTCNAGSSIRSINSDGTVVCEPDNGGVGSVATRLVSSPFLAPGGLAVYTLSCNAGEVLLSGGCVDPAGHLSILHYSGPLSSTQWMLKLENVDAVGTTFACRVVCLLP